MPTAQLRQTRTVNLGCGFCPATRTVLATHVLFALLFVLAPHRVVSLAPTLSEITCALGQEALLVGVTRFDDFPPSVKALPKVGGFTDPSLEAIVALRPDVVLLNPNEANQSLTQALDKAHVHWLSLADGALTDFAPMVRALAKLFEAVPEGERLVADFERDLAALAAHTRKGRALVLYGHRPLVAAGPGSFGAELLQAAGIANAYGGSQRYPHLDMEAVLQLAPDWLIDLDMNQSGASDTAYFAPFATPLEARHIRLVYRADAALLRLGPRLPKAMTALVAELK